ncbi:prepilin peptidase [Janibacter cremeus]|uniref:prepilin peptidase n=1 Tax=Janibacter cremeus TaxID=1285192 RepID=UPI0023F71898|nr:prepilin peptidase [Janibacter cremeus]WEV77362.1 prepilin peptidase [Janibacter cremeus]
MSDGVLPWVGVAALLGGAVGLWCARWLRSQAYRYEDEVDLPTRRVGWVVLACVLLPALLVLARPDQPLLVTVQSVAAIALVVLGAIDIDVFRLPDMITYPLAAGVVVGLLGAALVADDVDAWVRALISGLALGGFYLVLVLVGGGAGMGLGDAKLAPSLGMLLGHLSWAHVLLGTLSSFLLAGVAAAYLVVFTGAGRKSHLAFGPYLVAGTLLVLVAPAVGALLQEIS